VPVRGGHLIVDELVGGGPGGGGEVQEDVRDCEPKSVCGKRAGRRNGQRNMRKATL
jgi:hypothetical protein